MLFCSSFVQSAHPRGVRYLHGAPIQGLFCFNPRIRVGCDFRLYHMQRTIVGFNPRTYTRCDYKVITTTTQSIRFQSAHSRGVRSRIERQPNSCRMFQSAHSRGVRLILPITHGAMPQFQSAHSRGVRLRVPAEQDRQRRVSIRALAWSAIVNVALTNLNLVLNPQFRVYLAHQSPL